MRNQSGQSLLELMASIVIITTALAGVVAIFPFIVQKNMRIQIQNKAVNIAQSEMERLRTLSYYDRELDAVGNPDGVETIKEVEGYLVRITIKYIESKSGVSPKTYPTEISEDTGLKEITVSVKRKDNLGKQVNLITYFSKARASRS